MKFGYLLGENLAVSMSKTVAVIPLIRRLLKKVAKHLFILPIIGAPVLLTIP